MLELAGLGYLDATIVLTGGSSGMGEAAARLLTELGAKVHIVDIQEPKTACAGFHKTDLSEPDQVSATAAQLQGIGPVDFLFCCAGIPPNLLGPLKCMLVNYVGNRQFVEAMQPALKDGAGIAIISSDACLMWQQNLAQNLELLAIPDPHGARRWCEQNPDKLRDGYTTSKEMLAVWVQHAAVKLGTERSIRINCIAPCPTKTAFVDTAIQATGPELFENFPYPVLHRMATPEEQAWPLILLNSPLNAAVTGAVLYTDQGFVGGVFTGALDGSFMSGPRAD